LIVKRGIRMGVYIEEVMVKRGREIGSIYTPTILT